jgi:bacillolysin
VVPHRRTAAVLAVLLPAVLVAGSVAGPASATPSAERSGHHRSGTPGPGVHLVRGSDGRVLLLSASGRSSGAGAGPVRAAEAHLSRFAAEFGVRAADLRVASTGQVAGRTVVRFQQTRAGLPVFGGQLVTVMNSSGGLLSLSGETARARLSSSAYRVAASTAALRARRAVAASAGVGTRALVAARPTRWLLDRSLLDPTSPATLRPVWRTTVTAVGRPDIRDEVFVDAGTGRVALRLSDVEALDRVVCDDVRTRSFDCKPSDYDRVEAGAPTGIPDVDQAYDLTGVTSEWYAGTLGVDLTALIGDDLGDGRKLRSTTNYCPPGECPLDNAFWSGTQMVYGAGYTSADDVVAHELTHGVTQHTAGLVYWFQSGAINESMSDVFGELIDQTDGVGNDAPEVRWNLGEDLPGTAGGVTRDMADPPRYGQPDTTASPLYDTAPDYDDNGAVHTDSGVPNKAAYLIADGTGAEPGGVFAGRAFPGIGLARTATLYWATLQMLTPGADFADLAAALEQACTTLAFTPDECATVVAAVDATGLAAGVGPGVPRQVAMIGGPGEVVLDWEPPASTGSARLRSYVISVSPDVDGSDFVTVDPAATGWVLDGLTPGVGYRVSLQTVTSVGTSPAVTRTFRGSAVAVRAPGSVPWGHRVHLAGILQGAAGTGLGGRLVRLVRKDAGQHSWVVTDSVRSSPDGSFAFSWRARRSGAWFVLYRGTMSEIGAAGRRRALAVRSAVSVAPPADPVLAGQALQLTGHVSPSQDGPVALQRRTASGWVSVARGRVTEGRWDLTWRVPHAGPVDLRLRVPARRSAGLAAGTSRTLHLTPR